MAGNLNFSVEINIFHRSIRISLVVGNKHMQIVQVSRKFLKPTINLKMTNEMAVYLFSYLLRLRLMNDSKSSNISSSKFAQTILPSLLRVHVMHTAKKIN